MQPGIARKVFEKYGITRLDEYFNERTVIIPNTHDMTWNWNGYDWSRNELIFPPQDTYNHSFFKDIGLLDIIEPAGYTLNDTLVLLQHTRIVPRKKIEFAIDLAFALERRFETAGIKKCIVLLISGHSGDEQAMYKEFLHTYYRMKKEEYPASAVYLIFGENQILSHRDIIVDKKYYNFAEIPSIIAAAGGIGTYFSQVEGFGNNLLEMLAAGLPVVINKYGIYKTDLEPLGFKLPSIEENIMSPDLIETTFKTATDYRYRNQFVVHNLRVIAEKLSNRVISDSLRPLINNIFTKGLH
jgi:glycosyltransferase involved in cell wall biosynthesis